MWYFILFLFGLPVYIHGNVMDEMKERMQLCCDHGTDFAYNSTAEDCSSVKVPPDLLNFAPVCKYASERCCQEYNIKKVHCEKGIQLAKTSQLIMSFKENLEKNCFDQCELGAKVGKSNGIASCKVTALRKSAEHLLFSDAFFQCCKAATDAETDARDNPNKSTEKGFTLDTPIIVSSMSSMCEEFPPHDLCAHHCIPVPGSYKCECSPGYVLMSDGHSCEKVINNRCDPRNTCQHECIDDGAVIKCSCKKGYQLMTDKSSCEDINECALGIHNCERDGDQYQCVNVPGSYHCVKHINSLPTPSLKAEAKVFQTTTSEIVTVIPTIVISPQTASTYVTSELTTYDIYDDRQTLEKPDNKIDDEQPGFISENISNKFSANKILETIKEYESLLTLESTESLQNLSKSTEADETLLNSEVTEVPKVPASPKLPILNTDEKTAPSQKFGDDSAIVNTDKVPKNDWNQINETSSDCQTGFDMDSVGLCFDIDECAEGTHLCNQYQNCFNTNGSYECRCTHGFELDSTTGVCVDVDECATGETLCGPLQVCTNIPGGYTCSCPAGHKLVGDHVCEDVDECALGGSRPLCSQNADCINTVGSYQCRCHQGFKTAPINDKVCVDVDECIVSRPGTLCQHHCDNMWGGYRCSCHRGYRLNPADNRTCTDVDECTESKHRKLCTGRCLNEPGSYRCFCPSGYTLSEDKRSCIDINECKTGEAPCANGGQYEDSSVVCLNTRGGYQCLKITCPLGYELESKHRCVKIQTHCPPADWACFHQPSTYSYNYITFVSNLYISESKVDLFTMKGPSWPYANIIFELRLVDVDASPSVKEADINDFLLTQTDNQAVMSLVRPLEGPQSIELELLMELFSREQFGGSAVAKIYIYVSEYEF